MLLDESHVVADFACHTGEGPLWHPDEQALYWVDIPRGMLLRFDPESGSSGLAWRQDAIGGLTLEADGALLLLGPDGRIDRWRDGAVQTVVESFPEGIGTRFNDAIADANGRVIAGTMPTNDRPSHLFRIQNDRTVEVLHADLGLSNGMAFTPDGRGIYHADTARRIIQRFDYPQFSSSEAIVSEPEHGSPDGLCADVEGCLWSARWGGHCLVRHAPDGRELSRIELPTPNVSSAAFGGADMRDLYITTAGGDQRDENGPLAGALFRVRVDVPGRTHHRSRLWRASA